jgi:hypothetical protein
VGEIGKVLQGEPKVGIKGKECHTAECERDTSYAKFTAISQQISLCVATKCFFWILPDKSGMIRTQMWNAQ